MNANAPGFNRILTNTVGCARNNCTQIQTEIYILVISSIAVYRCYSGFISVQIYHVGVFHCPLLKELFFFTKLGICLKFLAAVTAMKYYFIFTYRLLSIHLPFCLCYRGNPGAYPKEHKMNTSGLEVVIKQLFCISFLPQTSDKHPRTTV